MQDHVLKILSQEHEPQLLGEFRHRLTGLVKMSRDRMKEYYPMWDRNDAVYQGKRTPDLDDKKAEKRKEPGKVYVPLTHAQVQTFVSFAVTLLTQRDFFFELQGTGIEDTRSAKIGQALLQRDLNYNKFTGVLLPQFLTDVARFGVGIFKSQWKRVVCPYQAMVPDPKFKPTPGLPAPVQPPMVPAWQEKTKYLGNAIEVVSPYRWFPDVRLPITRYREGEFCADENEMSVAELKKMERNGMVAGLAHVSTVQSDALKDRRTTILDEAKNPEISNQTEAFKLITEVEVRLNPAETFIDDGVALDPTCDAELVYIVWIANDSRIIRIDDGGYDHNEFLFDAGQFFNDQNQLINFGIAELIGPMQDLMDWLLNVRITNVRKSVQNFFVADPKHINLQDMADRNPVIRLKSSVQEGMAINNYIQQLAITDVTAGHITDMGVIKNFSEDATGLTENLQGHYNEGRRSARESSNVNANAAGRAILPVKGLWQSALLPLGEKMIGNHRQGLDEDQLVRVIGIQRFLTEREAVANFLPVNKDVLVGSYDFALFEATLPSQRMAIANTLQAAGDVIAKNPMSIFVLQKDPKLLFEEWLELQGVRNAERFNLTPQRAAEIVGLAQLAGNSGGAKPPQGNGGPGGQAN